jgi:hypothetical protein
MVGRAEHFGVAVDGDTVAVVALNGDVAHGFEESEDFGPLDVGGRWMAGEVLEGVPLLAVQVVLWAHSGRSPLLAGKAQCAHEATLQTDHEDIDEAPVHISTADHNAHDPTLSFTLRGLR